MKTKSSIKSKKSQSKRVAKSSTPKHRLGKLKAVHKNTPKAKVKRKLRSQRPVHKKVLLHPVSVLLMLCVGVFIVGLTYRTFAASYSVHAVVPWPTLTEGAVITWPHDGDHVTSEPINVTGTCPKNSYVKLYNDHIFSGVAWCSSSGTFSILTYLYLSGNLLIAQDYNPVNVAGPASPNVTVHYSLHSYVNNVGGSTKYTGPSGPSTTSTSNPLVIQSDFNYQTFAVGNYYNWTMNIVGGTLPYKVHILWGDGQTSDLSFGKDVTFQISHKYDTQGYYSIKVFVTDAVNKNQVLQLAALIKQPGSPGLYSPGTQSSGSNGGSTSGSASSGGALSTGGIQSLVGGTKVWLLVAWPSFIIVTLMMVSFWLGERQEITRLLEYRQTAKKRPTNRRRHAV